MAEDDVVTALTFFWSAVEDKERLIWASGAWRRKLTTPELTEIVSQEFDIWIKGVSPVERRALLKAAITNYPADPPEEIMQLIENILEEENCKRSVIPSKSLLQHDDSKVGLWKGDITTLEVDAVVNAANAALLGCFQPNHPCIDNAIHCAGGPRLRAACRALMQQQAHPEPTGTAKITPGFKLPCKYVLHTVGPIVRKLDESGLPPANQEEQLASCYTSCLNLARDNGCRSVAFCCISTGVFGYPQEAAAKVALATVKSWLLIPNNAAAMDYVIFNVFLPRDLEIYATLMPQYFNKGRL